MTLYSKEILIRSKQVTASQNPLTVTHTNRLHNPICGDRVEWQLHIVNQEIIGASAESKGCALCKASTSLLSEGLVGGSTEHSIHRIERFMMDLDQILESQTIDGEASLFAALPTAPARRECVVLPWKCLLGALSTN